VQRPHRPILRSGLWMALCVVLLSCGSFACGSSSPDSVRIATGQRGGTFLPLGETLARGFAADVPGTQFAALESPGSVASVEMLGRGEAELALLSNHVAGATGLELVAPLYEETLQVVVRRDAGITRPLQLAGRRIGVGPAGSGTESIADVVLLHFGIGGEAFDRRNLSVIDAVAALEAGTLDAAFIVAGMRTPAVDGLLARGDMRLLSLGEPGKVGSALEGIKLDAPFFSVTAIPEHAYGAEPTTAIGTISVHALLVARADLDEDLVFAITESLYSHKVELAQQERLLSHLSERYDPALSPYPLHAGADRYYRRDEPSLVQRYLNEISLAITIGALLWSAISGLRAAREQARRNRIESHYAEAKRIIDDGAAEPAVLRERLVAARDRALGELADERLDANDAYLILQDYLNARIAELDRHRIRPPGDC
jgi:uncharacterized protein